MQNFLSLASCKARSHAPLLHGTGVLVHIAAMFFTSDNATGASQPILEAILKANASALPSYGADPYSTAAAKNLNEIFERDCAVFLVATGTAANALALAAVTPPWGAVFCHAGAHINEDECGAPEFFTGGAKLVGIAGQAGKITPDALAKTLLRFPRGVMHHVQPGCLSLSQATEAGTIYSCAEIAALAGVAHAAGMAVHMDGARFANALATHNCSAAAMTWQAGVDVLSFGASKNGTLACEAVIFFDPAKAKDFAFLRKRAGHTLSKGRLLGAQMQAYLDNGHWLDLARHANAAATQLAQGLARIKTVRLPWPVQANEVFAILPASIDAALRKAGAHYYHWHDHALPLGETLRDKEVFARLVTSFATQPEAIAEFHLIAASA